MEDAMCYSRYWEAEEAKTTQQQAKDREAQAKREDRVKDLLTEANKQAEERAREKTSMREIASAK
jgi:hypothetical protein